MPQGWLRALRGGKPEDRGKPEDNRRRRQRLVRYFDCTWSSQWGEERARISNISPTGCYIESRFSVPAKGTVLTDLTFTLSTQPLTIQGTVIDATPGVGFAVRFIQPDSHTLDSLNAVATTTAIQH
jgi:PilZ domain